MPLLTSRRVVPSLKEIWSSSVDEMSQATPRLDNDNPPPSSSPDPSAISIRPRLGIPRRAAQHEAIAEPTAITLHSGQILSVVYNERPKRTRPGGKIELLCNHSFFYLKLTRECIRGQLLQRRISCCPCCVESASSRGSVACLLHNRWI